MHTLLDDGAQVMRPRVALSEVELTPRQQEIATLIAAGCTTREVAEELGISPRTVETHRRNLAMAGLVGVADLTRYVILRGWMTMA